MFVCWIECRKTNLLIGKIITELDREFLVVALSFNWIILSVVAVDISRQCFLAYSKLKYFVVSQSSWVVVFDMLIWVISWNFCFVWGFIDLLSCILVCRDYVCYLGEWRFIVLETAGEWARGEHLPFYSYKLCLLAHSLTKVMSVVRLIINDNLSLWFILQ